VAKSKIGVDIGSTSIRAVEVRKAGKSYRVTRAAEVALPRGAVHLGQVRDPETITDAARLLWRQGKFSHRTVTVGLGGTDLIVRELELPWEPPAAFREALPLRVGDSFAVDPRELALDFHPLAEFTNRLGAPILRSMVVASMNVHTENTADALVAGKLKLARADFSPFALIRAAVATVGDGSPVPSAPQPGEEWDCEVIVDIGSQLSTVIVHRRGRPLFIRTTAAGSEATAKALADNLKVSFEQACSIRDHLGISQIDGQPNQLPFEVTPTQLNAAQYITNAMVGQLVQSARESVEFFFTRSDQVTGVSRILLSGGGTKLPGFGERLAAELRAPVLPLTPMAAFARKGDNATRKLDPRMATAFGLALEAN
jgi:type IV pilus assembly protein PilM